MSEDPIAEFKHRQRETWALGNFGDVATFTTQTAGHLVRFAGVRAGQAVLDVACGTGPVAITAARRGARVTGLDLTPELLAQARDSAPIAGLSDVVWKEGDAEALPFADASFDVVLSQFGHMFAPRPEVATRELLRVLKPGGRIAFATWPPEGFVGRATLLSGKYVPPPGPGVPPPAQWGDPNIVRDRLGAGVKQLFFERGVMAVPTLSPQHFMAWQGARIGRVIQMMALLKKEPAKLDAYVQEYGALVEEYLVDNVVKHEYLLSRAIKV
ncbi:MAG TPA: methyltransferase domain-containing protein [Planctomycetota bacterium]|nr:methyltransferase domain-containing protein [Planctomycetota bacterium]